MRHPSVIEWEERLKRIFDEIDDYLEDKYGNRFAIHPSRPRRDTTSNKEDDGLFNIGAAFSLGLGSRYGKGYVIDIQLATLDRVPVKVRGAIENDILGLIKEKLPVFFPDAKLRVEKDGDVYKIFGDLKLGTV